MLKNFMFLFLALRAADLLNLFGGLYLVPKFVAPKDLGAVLPITTFATLIAIPIYAIAMTALRESSRLRAERKDTRPFIRGIFAAVGVTAIIALGIAAALLPRYLERLDIVDSLSGYLAVTAAFLGCVSPVYLDQLQAAKRFGTVSVIEVSAAALRLVTMATLMPFRALAGYFAGGVIKPLVQIFGPLLALYRDGSPSRDANNNRGCGILSAPYWTFENIGRLMTVFCLLLPYLWLPMQVSLIENNFIRLLLSPEDSAGYYMATRISDLLNYISFPIMFVMFPYVTDKAAKGKSYVKMTLECCGVILAVAITAAAITRFCGGRILSLLPNGEDYTAYAKYLPMLIFFMALGAMQSIITNAFVAAGKFTFLWWFIPLNLAYLAILPQFVGDSPTLGSLIEIFTLFALVRCLIALVQLKLDSRSTK